MLEDLVIQEVRSIGAKMGATMAEFSYGSNQEEIGEKMNHLADRATEISGYHDHVFKECNVIRSHVSDFSDPEKHLAAVEKIMEPIGALEHWRPD